MSEVFSFRFPPETTWDEINGWPILSLILATAPRPSVGVLGPNEAKTHRPGFMKLTAGGLPDSVMLSALETTSRTLDVARASGASQFSLGLEPSASRGIHARFRGKKIGNPLGSNATSVVGDKRQRRSATARSYPGARLIGLLNLKKARFSQDRIAAIQKSLGARCGTPSANDFIKTKNKGA